MQNPPDDLDASRATIAARELVATASGYLTADVATRLSFEDLGPYKNLLKKFFSPMGWTEEDRRALAALADPYVDDEWWEHDLGGGLRLGHGRRSGRYELWATGAAAPTASIFDRVFSGPVTPEATPHPRKVKFTTGGSPAPGVWYRRHDPDPPTDPNVRRLLAEPDVADVMVAGDFVTVGLAATASWEQRLEPLLALITELYGPGASPASAPERTREELLLEAGRARAEHRPEELHLLDPDDPDDQARLTSALEDNSSRVRRIAVAVLAESREPAVRKRAADRGYLDDSLAVRRTAVDAAADAADEQMRGLFVAALGSSDPWTRWKAVRSLGELGVDPSRDEVAALAEDTDFQVRLEVARVLRPEGEARSR
jgi:hypothetical protein